MTHGDVSVSMVAKIPHFGQSKNPQLSSFGRQPIWSTTSKGARVEPGFFDQ